MRGKWNDEDLYRASRGNLLFMAQQSALMRAEVRARTAVAEEVPAAPRKDWA